MDRWLVFTGSGLSRCVADGDPAARLLEAEGWTLSWDGAPSRFEGWTWAAVELGCLPEDYDDDMKPGLIWDPLPLYRSVSLPELADILQKGHVTGGRNAFNGFDRRPFVFFSPAPTEACIWQGAETERTAGYIASREPQDPGLPPREAHQAFMARMRAVRSQMEERNKSLEFTSAVIRTCRVGLGYHYSTEHGRTGMNGEDEYGLFPGQVRVEDIEEVLWVKDLQVAARTSVDEARVVLARLLGEPCDISPPSP